MIYDTKAIKSIQASPKSRSCPRRVREQCQNCALQELSVVGQECLKQKKQQPELEGPPLMLEVLDSCMQTSFTTSLQNKFLDILLGTLFFLPSSWVEQNLRLARQSNKFLSNFTPPLYFPHFSPPTHTHKKLEGRGKRSLIFSLRIFFPEHKTDLEGFQLDFVW